MCENISSELYLTMENETESLSFNMPYAGKDTDCHIKMTDSGYDILFDGEFMASMATDENDVWRQTAGAPIPADIIEIIGDKIESRYL